MGGEFTALDGTRRDRIARLNADGTQDMSFDPARSGFNNSVYSVSLQTDGKIVAGGQFVSFLGISRSRIARLQNCTSPATGTDVISACGPYTWIDGITYTTNNNTATHTIPEGASNGCDIIMILNLTIGDVTAPVPNVAVLPDVTVQYQATALTAPTATDNCAGTITATHDLALPFTAPGTTVVTWTYDDGNGNISTQTQHVIITGITPDANNILYVNASATNGSGNGWANPIKELADAMRWAKQQNNFKSGSPLKIYVAKGIYKPLYSPLDGDNLKLNPADPRNKSFVMVNNVQLYGGFDPAGDIADLSHNRVFGDNGTILSGDIGIPGNASDNAYHIIIASGDVETALLDGFTVTNGNSNRLTNSLVSNNSLSNNYGTGIYNFISSPVYRNVIVKNNNAEWDGSGMFNYAASPIIVNGLFTNNYAKFKGGAMTNYSNSSPELTNVTIANNSALEGGGIFNYNSSLIISNTIFWGNRKSGDDFAPGADIQHLGAAASTTLSNSITQSFTSGAARNNSLTGSDPLFTDADNGDYRLKEGSPAANAGDNSLFPGLTANTKDLAGNPRLVGTSIDIGAYESSEGSLPVRWISFKGHLSDRNQAVLTWKTEEINVSHYEAERSTNGRNFQVAGTIAAATGSYALIDPAPVSGTIYYRIRQVDMDGTFSHSPIIALTYAGDSKLFVYPNPVKDNLIIELGPEYIGSKAKLLSAAGIVLQQAEVKEEVMKLNISTYTSGVYFLQLFDGKVLKLIRE